MSLRVRQAGITFHSLLGKKHWIGIWFDASRGHLSVFYCNMSFSNEATVGKYLTPLLQMLPYLARHLCEDMRQDGVMPYQFDRPKVISQNDNPPDSGLMAALMVTHAIYGIEACKNITYDSLGKEGESAAIMAYKFNEVL